MSAYFDKHPHIMTVPDLAIIPDSRGVGYVYYHSMLKNCERIAQTDAETNYKESFGTLLKRCVRTAITMQNMGIKPGDFISSCTFNDLNTCVPYIASFFTGAIMAPVDPTLSAQEIIHLLKQVSPKMIFVEPSAVHLIEEVVAELGYQIVIVVYGETTKYAKFDDFITIKPNEDTFKPREVESIKETALVAFSSGTTGRPKGICHSHLGILSNHMFSECSNFTIASFCSLYWTVMHLFLHISIMNGFERLVFKRFDLNDPWKIFNYKIDMAYLVPLQILAFYKHKNPPHLNLSNLNVLNVGGNHMTKDQILKLKAILPQTIVYHTYGQTELFLNVCDFPNNELGQRLSQQYPNSIGIATTGLSYKIVDLETEEILGPNKLGELRLKSKCQTTGYYNHDSADLFDSDGWLKTGDLAYYNNEKCFFIGSRIKESFKYLHNHISPIEIEDVLKTHPSIKNAAVLGVPHGTDDNHPMAIVELDKNAPNVTPEQIVKFVEERVEDKKRLRGGVKIVEQIPLTISNKIRRFKLTQMLINNQI